MFSNVYTIDYTITIYAKKLYRRAGGSLKTIGTDVYTMTALDKTLMEQCFARAQRKYK